MVGHTVSHYRIVSKLGAGGMGEVYLAQDTKLDRKIALKILPAELASNQERVRRFTQEAKAAAALNHPNIAHIYEIGEHDGTSFIAMEYVDGHTLRQLIYDRRTELAKLLRYLQHAAEGLSKAHTAGIVHRDLKPDNIMVTREGYTKILDFGLAKLIEPQSLDAASRSGDRALSEVATALMQHHSTPGAVLGTVGYMSPEQAQGKVNEIDHRSDVFSFGCILYEAITGRKAFHGKDAIDSLNRTIREQPTPIETHAADAPADLRRIVRRCLAKDPEDRYQTIKDVAIEIKEARRELQGGAGVDRTVAPSSASANESVRASSIQSETAQTSLSPAAVSTHTSSAEYIITQINQHKRGALLALAAVAVAAGLALYKYLDGETESAPAFQNFTVSRITTSGTALEANISPDGKYIVYLEMGNDGSRGLFVKQTATGNTIPIVPPTKGNVLRGPSFSPDGNFVYYYFSDRTKRGSLYRVSSVGGAPKKVVDVCDSSATVSPDGQKIAFMRWEGPTPSSIVVANADGTGERALATLDGNEWFSELAPAWSPDGRIIATAAGLTVDGVDEMRLLGIEEQAGAVRELSPKRWAIAGRVVWMPDGAALVSVAMERSEEGRSQVWRVSFPSGEPSRITNDVHGYADTGLGVTADGRTLVAVTKQTLSRIETVPAGGDTSRPTRLTSAEANQDGFHGFALAPDGRIVFSSFDGGQLDLWIMNADGSGRQRLTSDTYLDAYPVVSPDGRYVVFQSNRPEASAATRLWRMDLDGGNVVQLAARADFAPHVSPDSRWVIYSCWSASDKIQSIWRVPIEGGEPVRVTDYPAAAPLYSPDGQWIVSYFLDEQAKSSVWGYAVIPAAGGRPVRRFEFPSFQYQWVRWTPDGRHLSFIGAPPDPSNIWLQPAEGGEARKLTDFKTDYIYRHAWSRDGKTLALARGRPAFDVVSLKDDR